MAAPAAVTALLRRRRHGAVGPPGVATPTAAAPQRRRRPARLLLLLAVVAFAPAPAPVHAAYFLVEDGKERCFTENILEHQVLRMRYSMHDKEVVAGQKDDAKKSQCRIFVRNPAGKVVKEHALLAHNVEDALAFLAHARGAHTICLICESEEWFDLSRKETKWSLAFEIMGSGGLGDADPSRLASLAHLKGTQASVEASLGRVDAINSENEYEGATEAQFVRTSEAVNFDVRAFKVMQVVLISVATAFQLHNLVHFLRKSALGCMGCLPFRNAAVL